MLVTVKAYPTVSQQHGEAVCVAGIRLDVEPHAWVRLFPVPYRDLAGDQQFRKWQVIDLEAQRAATDRRPESFTPIVPTGPGHRHEERMGAAAADRRAIPGAEQVRGPPAAEGRQHLARVDPPA